MEATEELLVGVLTKTLNKTPEEISELLYQKADDSDELVLKEGALDLVLDADVTRVSNIKKSTKPDDKVLRDQYLKGVKEGKAELEGEIKTLTGLDTQAIGSDLVKEAVNHLSECNVPNEDQIKAHPLFVSLEKDRIPKKEYEDMKAEYDDFKLNQDKSTRLSTIKRDVLTIFAGLNPIVSENQTVAQTRQRDFLSKFEAYDYDLADDSNHLVKKDGTRLEDKHGNPIKFADFVKDVALLNYDFNVSDDKGNAGNSNDGNGVGGRVDVPKEEKEYMAQMATYMQISDPNERAKKTTELRKAWEESQQN